MNNHNEILRQNISEQIALEEQLFKIIEEQILEIDEQDFAEAKTLLIKTKNVLEHHFITLNELLDKLEFDAISTKKKVVAGNGLTHNFPLNDEQVKGRISRILRDDYSALNHITINNTFLHTAALALKNQEVATAALKHLENLAPFIVRIGELMPVVTIKELHTESPEVDLSVAEIALKNIELAWRRAS